MLPERVERWADAGLEIARRALWFPTLVLAVHIVASLYIPLYLRFGHLDIPMHLLGGFAIAYFFRESMKILWRRRLSARPDRRVFRRQLMALVCGSTVIWEIAEFISDRTVGTLSQAGPVDTLLDMLFGNVGGAAFILWTLFGAETESPLAEKTDSLPTDVGPGV